MAWRLTLVGGVGDVLDLMGPGVVCGGVVAMLLFMWRCFMPKGPCLPSKWMHFSLFLNSFGVGFCL